MEQEIRDLKAEIYLLKKQRDEDMMHNIVWNGVQSVLFIIMICSLL